MQRFISYRGSEGKKLSDDAKSNTDVASAGSKYDVIFDVTAGRCDMMLLEFGTIFTFCRLMRS